MRIIFQRRDIIICGNRRNKENVATNNSLRIVHPIITPKKYNHVTFKANYVIHMVRVIAIYTRIYTI